MGVGKKTCLWSDFVRVDGARCKPARLSAQDVYGPLLGTNLNHFLLTFPPEIIVPLHHLRNSLERCNVELPPNIMIVLTDAYLRHSLPRLHPRIRPAPADTTSTPTSLPSPLPAEAYSSMGQRRSSSALLFHSFCFCCSVPRDAGRLVPP